MLSSHASPAPNQDSVPTDHLPHKSILEDRAFLVAVLGVVAERSQTALWRLMRMGYQDHQSGEINSPAPANPLFLDFIERVMQEAASRLEVAIPEKLEQKEVGEVRARISALLLQNFEGEEVVPWVSPKHDYVSVS